MMSKKSVASALFLLAFSTGALASEVPDTVFHSEKTGVKVLKLPSGTCMVGFSSNTEVAMIHNATAAVGKDAGVWLFTIRGASLVAQATGQLADGSNKKILLDRENDLIKILLFEKELERNKTFKLVITSLEGRESIHEYNLSQFERVNAIVQNGCKKPTGLWQSVKSKLNGSK